MEDDDLWESNKLEVVLDNFQKNVKLGYYHHAYTFISETGDPIESNFRSGDAYFRKSGKKILWKRDDSAKKLHIMRGIGINFNMSSIVIRKELATETMGYLERIGYAPDFFMFFSALCSGLEIMADSVSLTRYRISHKSSDFKNQGIKELRDNDDWQLKDRMFMLNMAKDFGVKDAISMANYELLDFLTTRFIRQFLKRKGVNRKYLLAFLNNNKRAIMGSTWQMRYLVKNFGVLICIFISPKLARVLLKRRGMSLKRE